MIGMGGYASEICLLFQELLYMYIDLEAKNA